jgi:epoxyqueuosine reductase
MEPADTTIALKKKATELGFSLCGLCPAVSPPGAKRLGEWLAAGFAGEMKYLQDRREAYSDPGRVLDGVRSIVMLAMDYRTADPIAPGTGEGRVSRYAWSDIDYHDLIRPRLNVLADFLSQRFPIAKSRGVIDTAPILEREFAVLAGLGWVGKNTLLLNRDHGSWFFLAALLTDAVLDYDTPYGADHCGTCRACIDACPTSAFPQPYVLDASRCISYLTIELRNQIPNELRSGVEDWVFGCDVCQEVCPWNSRSPHSDVSRFEPQADSNPIDLIALFDLDDAAFRARFRNTPLWRPRRRGLLRNAAIALGNRPSASAILALARGLNDAEALIRGACAWALGRHSWPEALNALERRFNLESDASVRIEIELALEAQLTITEKTRHN